MENKIYSYAIIGAGAAGIHLALAMVNDRYFDQHSILIIDKSSKAVNDRTWCFWENGAGKWDNILHHSWAKGHFHSSLGSMELDLANYQYKMLRALDFYEHAKEKLLKAKNVNWVQDSIEDVKQDVTCTLRGQQHYRAQHVFDSRIDAKFNNKTDNYTRILQHFKGWIIETEEERFDPNSFVMMDFRLKWQNSTSFTYVLPLSPRKAMIEFTLFNDALIANEDYDKMLKEYIHTFLKPGTYQILEVEQGVIPMSDYPFHKHHQKQITKIGTAGGWVRPSSGYSFKNAEKYAQQIIRNIKNQKSPAHKVARNRFRIYDAILLNLLKNNNHLGEEVFHSMYSKNQITRIFKFLDEESSLLEDLKIISTFRYAPFLAAAWRWLRRS